MNDELKKKLLTRKFSSIEYMEEMAKYHGLAIIGMVDSINWFHENLPQDVEWESWHTLSVTDLNAFFKD